MLFVSKHWLLCNKVLLKFITNVNSNNNPHGIVIYNEEYFNHLARFALVYEHIQIQKHLSECTKQLWSNVKNNTTH